MLPPSKTLSVAERAAWNTALSLKAFTTRVARFNGRKTSALNQTFRSTAKKWRDYYGQDSGHSRIVIYDPVTFADAYVEAQQLSVNQLVSRMTCKHENRSLEVEEKEKYDYSALGRPKPLVTWTEHTHTCTNCGHEEVESFNRHVKERTTTRGV